MVGRYGLFFVHFHFFVCFWVNFDVVACFCDCELIFSFFCLLFTYIYTHKILR